MNLNDTLENSTEGLQEIYKNDSTCFNTDIYGLLKVELIWNGL